MQKVDDAMNWKRLERVVAQKLGGTRRLSRTFNWATSDFDVDIPDFPHWRVDAKYRSAPFKHHGLLAEVRAKYCTPGDVAVLVTKSRGEHGEVVSLSLDDFAVLLASLRAARDVIAKSHNTAGQTS